MPKSPAMTLATILLFSAVLAAGRVRKEVAPLLTGDLATALASLPYKDLREICQGTVVEQFGTWFPDWIVQYLKRNRFVGPSRMTGDLRRTVKAHADILRAYLDSLEREAATIDRYPRLYLGLEVRDLLSKVSAIATGKFKNVYDEDGVVHELQRTVSPHIDGLIQGLAATDLDAPAITQIGAIFKTEDLSTPSESTPALKQELEDLKDDIIPMLYHVLAVYTEPENGDKYKELDAQEKVLLQSFYDSFSYLLPPDKIRTFLFEKLLGSAKKDGRYDGPFFGKKVFEFLNQIDSPFKPLFKRDAFALAFDPAFHLADIHDAAQNFYFAWEFPTVFTGVSESDLELGVQVPQDRSPTAKRQRKIAKLHLMLYKVYTFARTDGTLPPDHSTDPIDVLRKLYSWVLDTKEFDPQPVDKEGGRKEPSKGYEVLLRPEKFKRHFVPLLALICSKIPDCTMDLAKTPDRKKILQKYRDFGNFEELKSKPGVASLLEPGVVQQLEAALADDEFKKFADDLDKLVEDNPEIKEAPLQKDGSKPGKITVEDVKRPKAVLPKNDKLQADFDSKIGNRFLPVSGDAPTPQQEKQFLSFVDQIEATDNPHKKETLRTLLIRFIYTVHKRSPKAAAPLVSKTIPYLADRLRTSYTWDHVAGLRNFLFMTMDEAQAIRYAPRSDDEALFYTMDVAFFLGYATEDYIKLLLSPQSPLQEPQKSVAVKLANEDRAMVVKKFLTPGGKPDKFRVSVFKNFITKEPLFLEKVPGMEFFVYFLDFFAYYAKTGPTPAAAFANYHPVFMSFYSFAARVRSQLTGEVREPYQYLLDQLERCLDLTEHLQHWVDPLAADPVCQLSHRKYAEAYFFYKTYLVATDKPFKSTFEERGTNAFNTHTRLFLVFASEVPDFGDALAKACTGNSGPKGVPICVSYRVYRNVLAYTRTPDMAFHKLEEQLKAVGSLDALATRVNMLNGLEAAYLNIFTSNMLLWDKVNFLFDSVRDADGNSLYAHLRFKEGDADGLANYLKRTFSKLTVDPHEATLAKAVQSILAAEDGPGRDGLAHYLEYAGEFMPMYLKLFLQFANSDKQFRRIADLLIAHGVSYDLVQLNDIRNDGFFLGLAREVQGKGDKAALELLKTRLDEKYSALLAKCRRVVEESVRKSIDNEADIDLIDSMLGSLDDDEEVQVRQEKQAFDKVVLPEIVREAKEQQIEGLPKVDVHVKVVKKVHVIASHLDNELDLQIEDDRLSDLSEFDLDLSVDAFAVDLTESPRNRDRSLVKGVAVEGDKVHLVNSLSNAFIQRVQQKAAGLTQDDSKTPKSVAQQEDVSSPRSRSKSSDRNKELVENVLDALIKKKLPEFHAPVTRSQSRKQREEAEAKLRAERQSERQPGTKNTTERTNRFDNKLV